MPSFAFTDIYGHRFAIEHASGPHATDDVRDRFDAILHDPHDDAGDASEWEVWAGRVGATVAVLDSDGHRSLVTYETDNGAAHYILHVAGDYAANAGEDDDA